MFIFHIYKGLEGNKRGHFHVPSPTSGNQKFRSSSGESPCVSPPSFHRRCRDPSPLPVAHWTVL